MEQFLRVGVIATTHGVHGEVKVYPTTDDLERFKSLKQVVLVTQRKEEIPLTVTGVKFFKQFAILKFQGIDNIDDIQKYKGCDLLVSRENAQPLAENEYYIGDLIGMKVRSDAGENLVGNVVAFTHDPVQIGVAELTHSAAVIIQAVF